MEVLISEDDKKVLVCMEGKDSGGSSSRSLGREYVLSSEW